MLPRDLKPAQFDSYPPEARKVVIAHLEVIRQLPLSFVPSLLREVIEYDYRFPAERSAIDHEFADLEALSPEQIREWFHGFSQLSLSPELEQANWVDEPGRFTEQLSAYLWSTHQMDAFRATALEYGKRLDSKLTVDAPPVPRLGIAIIGKDVSQYDGRLFQNLRRHGTYFDSIHPQDGVAQVLEFAAARAQKHPGDYRHWYIDGGMAEKPETGLTSVSYHGIEPLRDAMLRYMQAEINRPGMGPEELRTRMAKLSPADLGAGQMGDAVLGRYQLKLLTEGSGTQIFSTTFVQWATRECLRRAQPLTLVARYAPRQRQRSMNELLSGSATNVELDPAGSLVDADMAAYYHWINQQRLLDSERSAFVVWYEGHSQALAIGPALPRGTKSSSKLDMRGLLALITA